MTSDKKIINELRKAYDMMLPEQMDEYMDNIEAEPISDESRQRIREMVNIRMKKTDANKKSTAKTNIRRWIAAAAVFAVVAASVTAFSSKTVRAAVARLFGFAPGIGVVETEDDLYVMEGRGTFSEDEQISIEIKDAVIINGELELRYTLTLKNITDKDLEENLNTVDKLYEKRGYDVYFTKVNEKKVPISDTVFEGKEIVPCKTFVTETESLESVRQICVSQRYEVMDYQLEEVPEGILTVGGLSVPFRMKKADIYSSEESIGEVAEIDGIKVLCVPTREDNVLSVDYYLCDKGEYDAVSGFFGYGNRLDVLTVNDNVVDGFIDEGYIFWSDDSMYMGSRISYDLGDVSGNTDDIVISSCGIYAEKAYDEKGIFFDRAPSEKQEINEVIEFDEVKFEVAEISCVYLKEEDGYEEMSNGYLTLRYKAESGGNKHFAGLSGVGINGEIIEGYYVEDYDGEYKTMHIPLNVGYDEVRSIDFMGARFMIEGMMEFNL